MNNENKHIPYATQWLGDDDIQAVADSLRSSWLTQGPKVGEFEEKIARYCGVKYAVALNSGTSALHAACFAAGIGPGDQVITSPITFAASANCVLYCGGKPVFADIEEENMNIDPEQIAQKIDEKTKAIIPVHFAGHPCDLEKIKKIAKATNLIVIEDAAHALGGEYKKSKIGSCEYSDMTILSFHAVKHITTGEGGMVLTNNEEYFKKISMFRTHGITKESGDFENKSEEAWFYEMEFLGYNYRLTDFQSALGLQQMNKLDKFLRRRREIVAKYNDSFKGIGGVKTPKEKADAVSAWHIYTVQVGGKRKEIFDVLRKAGIGVNVHYIPVYWHPYYKKLGYEKGLCPKAEKYYQTAITLPLYPKMNEAEVDRVIKEFINAVDITNK